MCVVYFTSFFYNVNNNRNETLLMESVAKRERNYERYLNVMILKETGSLLKANLFFFCV